MSSEATAAVAAGATETTPSVPTATPATDGTTMVMTANASSNAFAVAPTTSSTTTPSTTTSVLPSPSMPLARSLSHVPCESVAAMSAMELLAAQLDCGAHGAHTEVAVDAIQRVAVVARTLGPIATRSTLLPYLTQMVVGGNIGSSGSVSTGTAGTTDAATATSISDAAANSAALLSDELLLLLGQELSHVIPLVVGGSSSPLEPNNSSAPDTEDSPATVALEFLPLLERLATTEETVVRDQAVIVLRDLCQRSCSNNNTTSAATTTSLGNNNSTSTTMTVISAWMAMVKRLAGADWFTSKVSCAGILPTVLLLCQDHVSHQLELLSIYKDVLCADETPMVRRAAAQNLGMALRYAGYAHHRDTLGAITPALLTHDEQDSVRLAAVAALAQAGPSYAEHPSWTIQHWLPILKDGSTDMSWYVVFVACDE